MTLLVWLTAAALWAQQPVANFTVQSHVCTGQSVVFFNLSQNANAYRWNFGGGTTSTAVNPVHIYSVAGVYTVQLIAENTVSGLSDTLVMENFLTVHETPDLPLTIQGPTEFCLGDTLALVTRRRDGFIYQWFNGGVAIPEATDTLLYVWASGHYTLRISNPSNPSGACVQTHGPVVVTVYPVPEIGNIVVSGGTNICPGTVVAASVLFDPDAQYQWYRGATPLTGQNAHQIVVADGGSYWVEAFNAGGCRDTSDTLTFVAAPAPNADILVVSGPTTFCAGDTLVLSAPFLEALEYTWLKDGLPFPGAGVNTAFVTQSGDYQLVLENSQGCRDTSETIAVVVHPPGADGIFSSHGFLLCESDSALIYFNLQENKVFSWFKNGQPWDYFQTSFWVYESATYLLAVRDTVTGCADTLTATINFVQYPPVPEIFFEGENPFCFDQSLALFTPPQAGTTYQWYKDDASIDGATGPQWTVDASGFYSVAAVNEAGCVTFSPVFQAVRLPEPVLPSLVGPTVGCQGEALALYFHSRPGQTYAWYRGGQIVSTDTFVVVTQNGLFRYAATDTLTGCRVDSEPFEVVFQPRPPVPSVVLNGPESVCPGQSTTRLRIADYSPADYQYTWYWNGESWPDSLLGDVDGAELNVRHPGAYFLVAVDASTACASSSDTFFVGAGMPIADDSLWRDAAWPDSVCAGDSIRLFVVGAEGVNCRWFCDDRLLAAGAVYEWYAVKTGVYRVEFSSGGCVNHSNPLPVFVRLSDVRLSGFPDSLVFDRTYFNTVYVVPSDSAWQYQWYFDGVPVPGANRPQLTSYQNGAISVQVRDPAGCVVHTDAFEFVFSGRTGGWSCPTKIASVDEGVNIRWGCRVGRAAIYDLFGRIMWRGTNLWGETHVALPAGIFFLSADDATWVKIFRP